MRRAGEAQDAFEMFLVEEEEPFDDTYDISWEGDSWFRQRIQNFQMLLRAKENKL